MQSRQIKSMDKLHLAAKHVEDEGHRHLFGEGTYKMETDDKSGSEQLSSVCKK